MSAEASTPPLVEVRLAHPGQDDFRWSSAGDGGESAAGAARQPVAPGPGVFAFTGEHDGGPLPPARANAHYSGLAESLARCKGQVDQTLLGWVEQDAKAAAEPTAKRTKTGGA